MRMLLFALIFVSPPFLKRWLLRWFCSASIAPGARIGWFSSVMGSRVALGQDSTICSLTLVRLGGELRLGRESEISSFCLVYGASDLIVGDRSYIGPQSLINVEEPVRLGNGSALGPRSMVFTHGSFLPYTKGYWSTRAGVIIGDEVWCAAGVFIHPGGEIGDETFVNAMSVVTGSIPGGSVVEGNPARVTRPIETLRRTMTPERWQAAVRDMVSDFARYSPEAHPVEDEHNERNSVGLVWHGRRYHLRALTSDVDRPEAGEGGNGAPQPWLLVPSGEGGSLGDVLLRTAPRDRRERRLARALATHMRRYYGVRLYVSGAEPVLPLTGARTERATVLQRWRPRSTVATVVERLGHTLRREVAAPQGRATGPHGQRCRKRRPSS